MLSPLNPVNAVGYPRGLHVAIPVNFVLRLAHPALQVRLFTEVAPPILALPERALRLLVVRVRAQYHERIATDSEVGRARVVAQNEEAFDDDDLFW